MSKLYALKLKYLYNWSKKIVKSSFGPIIFFIGASITHVESSSANPSSSAGPETSTTDASNLPNSLSGSAKDGAKVNTDKEIYDGEKVYKEVGQ